MDGEALTISSATGVDVTLDVAGPGSRSYAFIVDWHIRAIVAVAWFVCAALATSGQLFPAMKGGVASSAYIFAGIVPSVAIYFLYHPVLEAMMRGRTPGKRFAGVRVVTMTGATPSTGAILIRNLFRLIDSLPSLYVVGLVTTLVTANRVRVGDLAAGTILVHDRGDAFDSLVALGSLAAQTKLDPATLEVARDLLQRWRTLDVEHRISLARTLLAHIEPDTSTLTLQTLNDGALRDRLQAFVDGGAV